MNEFTISTDRAAMDAAVIHGYLSEQSYWNRGVSYDNVVKAMDNSICFGGFVGGEQVAFGRVVTDRTNFAWLADIFVLPSHQGKGYSKALMTAIKAHPDLQGLRRMFLGTLDAHSLYAQFGFTPLKRPERMMEINNMVFTDPPPGG